MLRPTERHAGQHMLAFDTLVQSEEGEEGEEDECGGAASHLPQEA